MGLAARSSRNTASASSGNTPRVMKPCTVLSRSPLERLMGLWAGTSCGSATALSGTPATKAALVPAWLIGSLRS